MFVPGFKGSKVFTWPDFIGTVLLCCVVYLVWLKSIIFMYKVHRKGLGAAQSATLPSPIPLAGLSGDGFLVLVVTLGGETISASYITQCQDLALVWMSETSKNGKKKLVDNY